MEQKKCFGSIEEMTGSDGFTTIKTRPECRVCGDFRDCLRQSKQKVEEKKEKDELRKQNLIAQIIDISHMVSNEIGSCLLDFLNRIYDSPLGTVLFNNPLLFCEVPMNAPSDSLSIPVSKSTLGLFWGGEVEDSLGSNQGKKIKEGFVIRIVLIQKQYANNRKANIGVIAHEVIRMISSGPNGIKQVLQTLSPSESDLFKKMDTDQRVDWLTTKWGFQEELEALKKETASADEKKSNSNHP